MWKLVKIILIFVIYFLQQNFSRAQENPQVGIDEKLGNYIPADAMFIDEHGQSVNLKSLADKPTILSLVYYRCPGICSPLLTGIADVVDRLDMEAGKDFNIITISFDPREDYLT
ncbi:MAG: SCO family protein, partial [Ignavibacteria bacterium]